MVGLELTHVYSGFEKNIQLIKVQELRLQELI